MNQVGQGDGARDGGHDRAAPTQDDARWHRVYWLVIVTTVVVIAALWLFSKTFSS